MATAILATATKTFAQTQGKKALLVIDVQENLLNPNSKLHADSPAIPSFIQNLNKSIKFFEENNMPVIYTVNEWTNPIMNMLTGNVCKKGAKGTGIDKRILLLNDNIYTKSKMSALANKELAQYLKDNAISELYITGLFAEYCVKGTAKAAIKHNYKVTIIEDAVGSKSAAKKLKSLSICKGNGSNIITSDQLMRVNNVTGVNVTK